MDFGLLLQLGASLLAILVLAGIAWKLGLGGDTRIRDEEHARELADEAESGFSAVDIAIDRAGYAALLRDTDGRVLLLRRHGSHFASRLLTGHASVRLDRHLLVVGTSDKRFGEVTLDLGNKAQYWAASLRRL
ncbi:hypothetical protein [Pelagerythrobacter sp.]|uniref:hypothetical protein n=1 Tax=Pelagerythrobacter sp. TaxID=2800702 RepID=UPI0035AD7C11